MNERGFRAILDVKRVVSELTEISQAIGEVADVRDKDQMLRVIKRTTFKKP
jgi:hypothetical protein